MHTHHTKNWYTCQQYVCIYVVYTWCIYTHMHTNNYVTPTMDIQADVYTHLRTKHICVYTYACSFVIETPTLLVHMLLVHILLVHLCVNIFTREFGSTVHSFHPF